MLVEAAISLSFFNRCREVFWLILKPMKNALTILFFLLNLHLFATGKDTISLQEKAPTIRLIAYERVIFDSKGAWRTDQNFVGNFKLLNWLRLEAGFRFGERA